ncbi:MAG: hypothetical protein E7Y34_01240 [Mycoplasma sp.]|nr:hypothetical protein [Mycoplasma sp.]
MSNVVKFWHNLGVNGFRFDAIKHIDKDFENGINNGFCWGKKCVTFLKDLINKSFLNNDNYFIFGESSGISVAEIKKYGVGNNKVVHSFYNFAWWEIGWSKKTGRNGFDKNWDYKNFHVNMAPFQNDINISPDLMTIFLTNHDTSRAISRWGDLNYWKESAKALAIMQFICKGIICIYQGEEIGMINVEFKNRNDFKDIDALNAFDLLVDKKKIYTEEQLLKYMNINSRDCSRSPMHWNSEINYGFSKNKNTWIKMANDFNNQVNVEFQKKDSDSILLFYKKLIELYKSKDYQKIFVDGESDFELLDNGVFLWKRTNKQKSLIAYINITNQTKKLETSINFEKVIISSYLQKYNKTISRLNPYEAIIVLND